MELAYLKKLSHIFSVTMIFSLLFTTALSIPAHAAPGDRSRVSVDSNGAQANDMSRNGKISGDGHYVVFESFATNLPGGTGGLFLKDRQTGATSRVGVDGENADISYNGSFIAFDSSATNEVSGDTNGLADIFVYDRQGGVTTRVSVDSSGTQSNDNSTSPAISGDGRYVAFVSDATNLVSGDTNGASDVFVRDRQTGITERVSIASDGSQANAISFDASISADGRVVVFSSNATNLVNGDTNGKTDVFARDRQTGATTRVSVNSSGVEADRGANDSSVSGDGRYVSFSSFSENLMSQPPLEFEHVFVHDRQTGITTLASAYSEGSQMIGRSEGSVISADGRYVAFVFDDRGDSLPFLAINIHDNLTGATISAPGGHNISSFLPSISADGRYITYTTAASLVADDTNGTNDVYLYEPVFTLDLNPTVISVQPLCSGGCSPSASTISFQVTFSEAVTGVSADDFALNITGSISGTSILDVSGSGNIFNVNVNTGTGDGTLRLDLNDNDSIQDSTLHPLGGAGMGNGNFNTGSVYAIDKNAPTVIGITRLDATPSTQGSIHFAVNFSEQVSGVDLSDFSLTTTGWISGTSLIDVVGSGTSYTVTVNSGFGDGALQLNLIDNDSIIDAVSSPLGGVGAGNGNFTSGEIYTFERNTPVIKSIVRMDSNPSTAQSVNFRLTFSEPVTGVDGNDFSLNTTGISGASIIAVNGSGDSYAVTVGTGTNSGSLRLDLIDNDTILDSANNPLGGIGSGNGNLNGETYTINKATLSYFTTTFRSSGSNDGWVLESNENSNVGGSSNSTDTTLRLGDNAQDAQYRAILHFQTEALPDNAVVTSVILTVKRKSIVGTNPFTTHQNILIDIVKGNFGFDSYLGSDALQPLDFQAPSSLNSVGVIQNNPVGDIYWALLSGDGNRFINLKGVTQLRLAFQLDDNDDMGDDFINFFSGDTDQLLDRPHLQIEYYVPR